MPDALAAHEPVGGGDEQRSGDRDAVRTCRVEIARGTPAIDFSLADEWDILVTYNGVPCAHLRTPSPGAGADAAVADALIARHADRHVARERFVRDFGRRLGTAARTPPHASCSVVVCTHRRPDYVRDALAAIRLLEPAPDEVLVVDNDPGPTDCRAEVEAAGAHYVREDRRGLNNARTAGLRASRGEVIAFTDDDCVPAPGWLRSLDELFEHPAVAAVTGPAFPFELVTRSQRRFEQHATFAEGLERRVLDWTRCRLSQMGRAGRGANMVLRRSALEQLADPFPPELDAGTATRSGGDHYLFFKLITAGRRIVYDPATYVLHRHRPDPRSLHDGMRGYGTGTAAVLTKLVAEDRESSALLAGSWILRAYVEAALRGLAGRADPVEVRIGLDVLRGGLEGPRAWRAAKRAAPKWPSRPMPRPAVVPQPAEARAADAGRPELSVVVPSRDRPEALARCLHGLGAQTVSPDRYEVVIADDSVGPAGADVLPAAAGLSVRRIATRGAGTASARNAGAEAARGELVLFLDDDEVPVPELVERHLERHKDGARDLMVVGSYPPRPRSANLAAQLASLWWDDHFETKRDAVALTFVDALTGNLSMRRELFLELGGFDVQVGAFRREDWEWGIRSMEAGAHLEYEPRASAPHEFTLDAGARLDAARREGRGDAILLGRHPAASPYFPPAPDHRALGRRPWWALAYLALRRGESTTVAARVLGLLERLRARHLWLTLYGLAERGRYERALRSLTGADPRRPDAAPVLRVELTSQDPIPRPGPVPPLLELTLAGRVVARVTPHEGQWPAALAEQVADALPAAAWHALAAPAAAEGLAARDAVRVLPAPRDAQGWEALDRDIRTATEELVVVYLGETAPEAAAFAPALVGLRGERVAAVAGSALPEGEPLPPLELVAGSPRPGEAPRAAIRYVALRRQTYAGLGGLDVALAALGDQAPVLDLLARLRREGYVVAWRGLPGIGPQPAARDERGVAAARGGLLGREAAERGSAWLAWHALSLPLARALWTGLVAREHRRGARGLGVHVAFLRGVVRGVRSRTRAGAR